MTFEYQIRTVADDSIEVEDVGNVCIDAYNDLGQEWMLIIHTYLGWTSVIQVGSIRSDVNAADNYFSFLRQQFEFNESKLVTTIDKFLTDGKKTISQVFLIDEDVAKEKLSQLEGVQINYG